jgi:hypothetical protein
MYPDCIISSIYGQMTFSNNYDLFGDLVKLLYNFILKIKMSGLQINHNYLKMSFVHK